MSFDAAPARLRNAKCERLVPGKERDWFRAKRKSKGCSGEAALGKCYRPFGDEGTTGSSQLTRAARVRSGFQYKIGTARLTSGLRRPFPLHAREDTQYNSGAAD